MHWADEECTPVAVDNSWVVVSKIRLVIIRIRSAGKVSVRQLDRFTTLFLRITHYVSENQIAGILVSFYRK